MSIIEKVFKCEETELSVINCEDDIWFKGKTIMEILGYAIQPNAIRDHVDPEDRVRLTELRGRRNLRTSESKQNETDPLKSRGSKTDPLTNNEKNTIYINESGLYSLIFHSKLESARVFKRWVTKEVLLSIRKTGKYSYDDLNHKYNDSLTFKIENEADLHTKVVSFLKKRYPYSIFAATIDKNQDTCNKRIESHKKGYLRGSPDLIINNLHKHYTGFVTEFKNPNGKGILSYDQSKMSRQYQNNGFKTLVSNDHDFIIE